MWDVLIKRKESTGKGGVFFSLFSEAMSSYPYSRELTSINVPEIEGNILITTGTEENGSL